VSHTALARRYRPHRFAEVTAQEHVSETLRRAVSTGRVGHAYLFCGPRGVGKTTLARVLAMALNCPERTPEGEPCGACDNCDRIWSGTTSLDVVEIDAASNRGVEDARGLRERAMYAPSESDRFKVYIVDEAHMLTREAWNALLKILEEPPPRVIFIFATTEPQKIGQTAAPILSRCQRFDLRRVGVVDIVHRLTDILAQEGFAASEEALRIIARKADGGMRDALSILDQVLALSDGPVSAEAVRTVLGIVAEDRYLELFGLLATRDRAALFGFVDALVDEGHDLVEFYHGLMEAIRALLRLRVGGGDADVPADRREAWASGAAGFGAGDLVRMLGMGAELETGGSLRRSTQPRVLIELLLLRFSYLDRTVELDELLAALGGAGRPAPEAGHEAAREAGRPTPLKVTSVSEAPRPRPVTLPRPDGPDARVLPPAERSRETPTGSAMDSAAMDVAASAPAELPSESPRYPAPEGTAREGASDEGASHQDSSRDGPRQEATATWRPSPPGDVTPARRSLGGSQTVSREEARGSDKSDSSTPGRERPDLREIVQTRIAEREGRISARDVQAGALRDLLEEEPGLAPAVEELDLELLD